jgi:hypothetical protein
MSKVINLTPQKEKELLAEIKREAVAELLTRIGNDWDYLQSAQVAGILNVNPRTLLALPIPRSTLPGGKITFYHMADVKAYLVSIREK